MQKELILQPDGSAVEISIWIPDNEVKSTGSEWFKASDGALVFLVGRKGKPMGMYRTFDEGETVECLEAGAGCSANIIRLKDGRLMSLRGEKVENKLGNSLGAEDFYAYFSSDDGLTWGNPVAISTEKRRLFLMNARLKRLSSGRIITPMGLHPDHLLEEKNETVGWIAAFWSDDEGQTWHEGEWHAPVCTDQLCEPMIAEMPDGSLKMLCRTGVGHLYALDSFDGGMTWSDEYATTLRSPCAPFTFTYDPYTEQYVVIWDDSFPGTVHQYPRSPIALAVSKDCVKWTRICELGNDPNGSYGYPAAYFTENSIMMGFYRSCIRRFSDNNRVTMVKLSRDVHPLLKPTVKDL